MNQAARTTAVFAAHAFGHRWLSDLPLLYFDAAEEADLDLPVITVRRAAMLRPRVPLRTFNRGEIYGDGFRYRWADEVVFDVVMGNQIEWLPGPDWRGEFPASLFSTVAALTLAWRGLLSFHATAVELDGCAILIAGPAGAGKSSLAAGLLGLGGRLVSDDLSVVDVTPHTGNLVYRGRPALRLHSGTAAGVAAQRCDAVPGDPRGKLLVRPIARSDAKPLRIGAFLLLGSPHGVLPPPVTARALMSHLFRPRWQAGFPGREKRLLNVFVLGASVPMVGFPAIGPFCAQEQSARASVARDVVQRLLSARTIAQVQTDIRSGVVDAY